MGREEWPTLYCACLVLVCSWGCGEEPGALVVAEVGSTRITQTDLRAFVENLPPNLRSEKQGQEAREDYLQTVIDRELMLQEAQIRGLDTAVVRAREDRLRTRVLAVYRAREILSQIHIGEEEIEQRFIREGLNRERKAWGIATKTREDIETVVEELESGIPFEEVALKYSIDRSSAERGGELGFIGIYTARGMGIPDAIFHSLPVGEVSEPLPSPKGYSAVRFTAERPTDLNVYRESVVRILQREKIGEREEEVAEILARKFDWRLHRDGLRLLLQKGRGGAPASVVLSPEEAQTPLYLFDGGQVTLEDYLDALRKAGTHRGLEDSATVVAGVQHLLRHVLFEEAARRAGIPEEETVVQWREAKRREWMLTALREAAVADAAAISEEEIRRYYDGHADLFRQQDTFWITEVLVATEDEALEVQAEIEAGADLADIARGRSLRPGGPESEGVFHLHPMDRYRYPELVPAVLAAGEDRVIGPVKVGGGYTVFRVDRRIEGAPLSYAEVRGQVEALVQRQKEQAQFEAFIQGLRRKYGDRIQVFEDRLAIALADEFLAGLPR